jgi:glycosyltransferase involved in cell wall biosynthesis
VSRLRILVLASFCDPEAVSMPYVAYCHAAALARLHDVTLVIEGPSEARVRRARGAFQGIEVVKMPRLERLYAWALRRVFRYNYASQALTAFQLPFALAFEWFAWRQLRGRIAAGEFDVVLRLLPITAVQPSPFAFLLRRGPIPIVVGPINGGLPFVEGFSQAKNQRQWISGFRRLYRYVPFARSTFRHAAAILAGSSHTCGEFSRYRDKVFFIPENGVEGGMCMDLRAAAPGDRPLELIFVGGLLPYKACDLALRAALPLLASGHARLAVLGDGPERGRLEAMARSLGVDAAVRFDGWVRHEEVLRQLRAADVFLFPSVRDFGAGVVFEALASGAVPVVSDIGGPGDIVHDGIGRKAVLTNEDDVVDQMRRMLAELDGDRALLRRLREAGIRYAQTRLTWEAKARDTTAVLRWVLGHGPKPALRPPGAPALPGASLPTEPPLLAGGTVAK